VWWPPHSAYGRPVSQPNFDFPVWARFSSCRPPPLAWGYDPFPEYGPPECECWGHESINCPGDFVAHRPDAWYAIADFAPTTIDHLDGLLIARAGGPAGAQILSTGDLRPEFNAGAKFTLGRRIFDCYRLEGTAMGLYDWDDSLLVTLLPADLATFVTDFSAAENASSVSITELSSFESAEINLRYWADMPPGPLDVSFLLGARYMQLDEQFNFVSNGAPVANIETTASNELWGVQVGIEFARLWTTRNWTDVDLKGGMYDNQIDLAAGPPGAPTLVSSRNRTTWVGDIAVVHNWQMTPSITLRIGYQAIFMDGVAVAQEQIRSPLINVTPGPFNDQGHVAIHGPILGVMGYW
jgi:hypothetical protein